jgi:UDP-N-acetylglucosamine 2-epimerase (non-hydrolysing)
LIRIDLIAGARPNFIKIAPIIDAIKSHLDIKRSIKYRLIHTGQHYDKNMSADFFKQLNIPTPNFNLEAGGGSQTEQTTKIMLGYELVLKKELTDYCLVVGDVTSTMACSIVAKQFNIKVLHVEAGIRSWDITMPEEINRILTDSITDYFFTTSQTANENLRKIGIEEERIFFVGNTMIDSLLKYRKYFLKPSFWNKIGLLEKNYIVMTLHRPSNVDKELILKELISQIIYHSKGLPIIFPVHPRTNKRLKTLGIEYSNLHKVEPLGYLEFNYLVERSKAVITDSGGITEETTILNIPCMTLRENTERPETVNIGTNSLLGVNPKKIGPAMKKLFLGQWKNGKAPPLWDGKTASRIISHIVELK